MVIQGSRQVGKKVVPLEIKTGKNGPLKSLLQFMKEKKGELACRFDVNLPSVKEASHGVGEEEVTFKLGFVGSGVVEALREPLGSRILFHNCSSIAPSLQYLKAAASVLLMHFPSISIQLSGLLWAEIASRHTRAMRRT